VVCIVACILTHTIPTHTIISLKPTVHIQHRIAAPLQHIQQRIMKLAATLHQVRAVVQVIGG